LSGLGGQFVCHTIIIEFGQFQRISDSLLCPGPGGYTVFQARDPPHRALRGIGLAPKIELCRFFFELVQFIDLFGDVKDAP
jgi:hypothetical protein